MLWSLVPGGSGAPKPLAGLRRKTPRVGTGKQPRSLGFRVWEFGMLLLQLFLGSWGRDADVPAF